MFPEHRAQDGWMAAPGEWEAGRSELAEGLGALFAFLGRCPGPNSDV